MFIIQQQERGISKQIEIKLLEVTIVADFLEIALGRIDIVLGFGFMGVHWLSMTITFMVGNTLSHSKEGLVTSKVIMLMEDVSQDLGRGRPRILVGILERGN